MVGVFVRLFVVLDLGWCTLGTGVGWGCLICLRIVHTARGVVRISGVWMAGLTILFCGNKLDGFNFVL